MLDEADEMLDMGFADDLERILGSLREPPDGAVLGDHRRPDRPPRGAAPPPPDAGPGRGRGDRRGRAGRVRQVAYVVRRADKLTALGRILDLEDGAATLVFARTRGEVDDLAEALSGRGRDAAALHGGLSQEQRDRIMARFRDGALDVLVATDVAARGLDIEHISHVVNYDVPSSPDTYVHRTGRTGRAGREGVAITLVEPREHRLLRDIERTIGQPLQVEGLPTVSDVREHRLDRATATLREALVAGETDRYRGVVEALSGEFDAVDIALAAVSLADAEARGAEDTTELQPPCSPTRGCATPARCVGRGRPRAAAARRRVPDYGGPRPRAAGSRGPDAGAAGPWTRPAPPRAAERGPRAGARRGRAAATGRAAGGTTRAGRSCDRPAPASGGPGGVTRVFVGAGRAAGMRPGDLVGAITNEAGLRGGDIGAIQIADGFSLVEVPEAAADHVIQDAARRHDPRPEGDGPPGALLGARLADRRPGRGGSARCRR